MNESFIIPVIYLDKEYCFVAQLFTSAYSYRIEVMMNDLVFNFERDDSGNFRAIAATHDDRNIQTKDVKLLQAIADKLEEILS